MQGIIVPKDVLVDARNFHEIKSQVTAELEASGVNGFDLETYDEAHEALLDYRKEKPKSVIFDVRRTTIAGFSIHCTGSEYSYYFNMSHADEENRLTLHQVLPIILLMLREDKLTICHNSVFELTMVKSDWGIDLAQNDNVVCTMIMAVTAYNPDEFRIADFLEQRLKPMGQKVIDGQSIFDLVKKRFPPNAEGKVDRYNLNSKQRELVGKVVAKSSTASFSYNGMVKNLAFGYGLKGMVQKFFNFKMTTFKECLGDKEHMGQLTGQETCAYGADDAFWAVKIYEYLLDYMIKTNPRVVKTFFEQENPMAKHYSQMWLNGLKVNGPAIRERVVMEREAMAQILRDLKVSIRKALPFNEEPHEKMYEKIKNYKGKNGDAYLRYRGQIETFANSPDSDDDYKMCAQVKSSISKAWAREKGLPEPKGVNLNYFVTMQTLLYDLMELPPQYNQGKLTADKDARENLFKEFSDKPVINNLGTLAGIVQRMSLFLTPYSGLTDPETNTMHPVVSSQLATRRLAASFPNPMQLSKRGESAYIRGFYLPDSDEDCIISLDWSQVELVLIGEFSGDPEFAECYGKKPYRDLHAVAAAPLAAKYKNLPPFSLEEFKKMEDYKQLRNDFGKGSNFEYWYSGGLWVLGAKMGYGFEDTIELSQRYAEKFAVAEAWRKQVQWDCALKGYTELPDNTRRVRYESTGTWKRHMLSWFGHDPSLKAFGEIITKKIQTRSGNQAVNALIQGTCATLAKRSAERTVKECARLGIKARFMMPIHDELVWSVNRKQVHEFLEVAKRCMTEHPDIVSNLVLDCTASVGNTFRPYKKESAPYGQIELDELPLEFCITSEKDGRATEEEIDAILEYLNDAIN